METFDETISCRMVSSSSNAGSSKKTSEGGKDTAFELCATVGGNYVWKTKTSNPMSDERLCNRVSCDVGNWYCLRPTSKTIDAGQKIGGTLGWRWRTNEVDVNMGKTGSGDLKIGERGTSVAVDLAALAFQTCSSPLRYIAIGVGPDISFGDQPLGCFDTGVREIVEGSRKRSDERLAEQIVVAFPWKYCR